MENFAWNHPIFFKRNRVFRVYKGGALFADLLCAFSREGAGTPLLSVDFNPSNL